MSYGWHWSLHNTYVSPSARHVNGLSTRWFIAGADLLDFSRQACWLFLTLDFFAWDWTLCIMYASSPARHFDGFDNGLQTYERRSIIFQTYFVQAFVIGVEFLKFSMLMLYFFWDNWSFQIQKKSYSRN